MMFMWWVKGEGGEVGPTTNKKFMEETNMKKIIATVLAMVMALALCCTAFAATTVQAKAYRDTSAKDAVKKPVTATFYAATAAKLDKDGKQTNTANVAYYVVNDVEYVVVSSLADADLVLYGDADATSVMLYLAKATVHYTGTGTEFKNFGKKCGQFDYDFDSTKTYYTSNHKDDKALYVADDNGAVSLMVGGKLVSVTLVAADATKTVEHTAIPTVKDGKVVGYTCSVCNLAAVKAANYASIPDGAQYVLNGTDYWYFPVAASSTTGSNSSPKTFDAGIAMYVGMALTSVAGSAVVIGKKKEF